LILNGHHLQIRKMMKKKEKEKKQEQK